MNYELKNIVEEVKQLAREAGTFVREQRKSFDPTRVESKHTHDYVSYVDRQTEQMIVARLKEIMPEAGFITEEQSVEQTDGNAEYCWVVDPLDGTTNFIHDIPLYCVCIALRNKEEILLGAVYEVTRDELFWAYKDGGAWIDDKRIAVSDNAFDSALVAVGYPYNTTDWNPFQQKLTSHLLGNIASIRSLGSAEGELVYVAAGRLDAYVESFIKPWDVAAGAVILKEAGGTISDYNDSDALWQSGRQVLATNGKVHRKMLEAIKKSL